MFFSKKIEERNKDMVEFQVNVLGLAPKENGFRASKINKEF